jgi:hypothetical protein
MAGIFSAVGGLAEMLRDPSVNGDAVDDEQPGLEPGV